jgi:hypothetical protein
VIRRVERGSSGFEDVPVLGAVKIVRPVGRCILTAPALRRRLPAVEEPALRATEGHRMISLPRLGHDLDNFIRRLLKPRAEMRSRPRCAWSSPS